MDIRREVLGVSDILGTAVNEVIALVEGKEMARNALPSANISRPYKREFQYQGCKL